MRFTNGFIMLPRDLRERYFYGDSTGHDLMVYILENAHWDINKTFIYGKGRHSYEVKYGQIATTKGKICEWLGIKRGVLCRSINKLKKLSLIDEKPLYNCSLFIVNPELMETTRKPDENHMETKRSTNEERINKKNLDVSKDTSSYMYSNPHSNSSLDSISSKDDAGTNNIFDIAENRTKASRNAGKGSSSTLTSDDLLKLWNEHSGPLPKCRVLSDKRKRSANARIAENPDQGYWIEVIKKLSKSRFAIESNWASFDWIIKNSDNSDKAFNGYYDNKIKTKHTMIETEVSSIPDDW